MSLQYLLDTNIISEPLRPKPSSRIIRKLRRHEDEIAIPSVVWHELRFGAEGSSRHAQPGDLNAADFRRFRGPRVSSWGSNA